MADETVGGIAPEIIVVEVEVPGPQGPASTGPKITVSEDPPENPSVDDVWIKKPA